MARSEPWQGVSDQELFAGVRYDPAPVELFGTPVAEAAGTLRFAGDAAMGVDEREARTIELLRRLRAAKGPRADALRGEVRRLVVATWPRLGGPLDLGWLTGLPALERLVAYSSTGIVGARSLAGLPALRHATLYAYGDNRIRDLDGIAQSRTLKALDLWWGSLGDLSALSGPWPLRRLSVHENRAFSMNGIEDLPIEEIDVDLPHEECDVSALAALRSLRSLTVRGPLSEETAAAIAACRAGTVAISSSRAPTPPAMARLPPGAELSLSLTSLDASGWTGQLPPASLSLSVAYLDAAGLGLLARAPGLHTLRVLHLDAPDLAPLADHPSLSGLRFGAAKLRSLDRVPRARLLGEPRDPGGPNRLVLKGAPLASIREIGHLRGVDHLDLRGCADLVSLSGVEGLHELGSIDLRECTSLRDLSALEALPGLGAVLVNHRGPPGPFPEAVRAKVVRAFLRGFVRRWHQGRTSPPTSR